eukprot:gene11737-biopygen6388
MERAEAPRLADAGRARAADAARGARGVGHPPAGRATRGTVREKKLAGSGGMGLRNARTPGGTISQNTPKNGWEYIPAGTRTWQAEVFSDSRKSTGRKKPGHDRRQKKYIPVFFVDWGHAARRAARRAARTAPAAGATDAAGAADAAGCRQGGDAPHRRRGGRRGVPLGGEGADRHRHGAGPGPLPAPPPAPPRPVPRPGGGALPAGGGGGPGHCCRCCHNCSRAVAAVVCCCHPDRCSAADPAVAAEPPRPLPHVQHCRCSHCPTGRSADAAAAEEKTSSTPRIDGGDGCGATGAEDTDPSPPALPPPPPSPPRMQLPTQPPTSGQRPLPPPPRALRPKVPADRASSGTDDSHTCCPRR